MADPSEPTDVEFETWTVSEIEESTMPQISIINEIGAPVDTFDNSGSTHTVEVSFNAHGTRPHEEAIRTATNDVSPTEPKPP